MKREDLRAIQGLTDEQVNAIMALAGTDAQAANVAKTQLQDQVNSLTVQLRTAQDGLKAFEGVDVTGLQSQITELNAKLAKQASDFAFNAKLRRAIREAGALDEDDVLALLPGKDELEKSQNQDADILKAITDYKEKKPSYFAGVQEVPAQGQPPVIVVPKTNPPAGAITAQDFAKYNAEQRIQLREKDPALFKSLVDALKKR